MEANKMAEIKNVVVTTEYKYDGEHRQFNGEYKYYIKLRIGIPGGEATYEIPTTKEINASLDAALALQQ